MYSGTVMPSTASVRSSCRWAKASVFDLPTIQASGYETF